MEVSLLVEYGCGHPSICCSHHFEGAHKWQKQQEKRHTSEYLKYKLLKHQELATMQQYTIHFGQNCTKAMSKCFSQLELSYDSLKSAFNDNIDDRQAFYNHLRTAGIKRKAWCEKI